MRQTWANIIWCHWPVPPDVVARFLPAGLTPDLYNGQAYVGLVPFSMQDLRASGPLWWVTSLLRAANFGEVNVRTYVVGPDGQSGVWFCTLDADSWWAVTTANAVFGLAYRRATTSYRSSPHPHWCSRRPRDHGVAELEVEVNEENPRPASSGLETFLVERYALYTVRRGTLLRGELHHAPWRVRSARAIRVNADTVARAGVSVQGTPHVLVGDPVRVEVYSMKRAARLSHNRKHRDRMIERDYDVF